MMLLSFCGHKNHAVCPLCVTRICNQKCGWSIPRRTSPMNFETVATTNVTCPHCRSGEMMTQPLPLQISVLESKTKELRMDIVLPGVWLSVYSNERLNILQSWVDQISFSETYGNINNRSSFPQFLEVSDWNDVAIVTRRIRDYLECNNQLPFCPFVGCPGIQNIASNNMESLKRHIKVCYFRPVVCPYCSEEFPVHLGANYHVKNDCQKVKCNLCSLRGTWNDIHTHIEQHNSFIAGPTMTDMRAFRITDVQRDLAFLLEIVNNRPALDDALRRAPSHTLNHLFNMSLASYDAAVEVRNILGENNNNQPSELIDLVPLPPSQLSNLAPAPVLRVLPDLSAFSPDTL